MKTCRVFIPVFAMNLIALSAAFAQRPVPPPPKPADSGPSLAVTMQFIQDKLNSIGQVNWTAFVTDPSGNPQPPLQPGVQITVSTMDPSKCVMTYRYLEPATHADSMRTVAFASVVNVTVEPWEQYYNRVAGTTHQLRTATQPPTLYLSLVRANEKVHPGFFFQDADLADRVAKAMVHAVELCGGGNKDPF